MKAFCFTLTLLCAVQSILAYPRPDFAISGKVSGSDTVKTTSIDLNAEITKIGEKTVTITSGYGALSSIGTALESIGDQIVTTAGTLATQLSSLATDSAGPIDTVYGNLATAITNLKTLFDSGLTATIQTITEKTGTSDIKNQFGDAFKNVKSTLDLLQTALNTLKSDVNAAKTKGGTAAAIRANIPAKDVNAVITQIRNLRARVQLITYVINSSLDNLVIVDSFVIALNGEILRAAGTYKNSYEGFQGNLILEKTSVITIFTAAGATTVTSIYANIQSDLTTIPKFESDLKPKLSSLNVAFGSIISESTKIETSFSTYSTSVSSIITQANLEIALGSALCDPLKSVSKVQIANAGNSDFCFSKYSPRLFAQAALTIDAFDACYEKELSRLMTLEPIIERIAHQLLFNTEDLFGNLKSCLAISDPAKKGDCLAKIAPYYGELASKVNAHIATTIKLVDAETKASYNRLGACIYAAIATTTVTGQEIATDANGCLTAGPQP